MPPAASHDGAAGVRAPGNYVEVAKRRGLIDVVTLFFGKPASTFPENALIAQTVPLINRVRRIAGGVIAVVAIVIIPGRIVGVACDNRARPPAAIAIAIAEAVVTPSTIA